MIFARSQWHVRARVEMRVVGNRIRRERFFNPEHPAFLKTGQRTLHIEVRITCVDIHRDINRITQPFAHGTHARKIVFHRVAHTQFDGGKTLVDKTLRFFQQRRRRFEAHANATRVGAGFLACTAEQSIHRLLQRLAPHIPQRHIHA